MAIDSSSLRDEIAVFYLARGIDEDFQKKSYRFVDSYKKYSAGLPHKMYIIYKGFRNHESLRPNIDFLKSIPHEPIILSDDGFDIEAYYRAAVRASHPFVFFLNTSSVLNGKDWLAKLKRNIDIPRVGLVGATGSYEGAVGGALQFPNPHIRSNAFMMAREDFLETRHGGRLNTKMDAYELEHGLASITAQCLRKGRSVLVVGKDGRGFQPYFWPTSGTFRQGLQENLLVRDGQTEAFAEAPVPFKRQLFHLAWGEGDLIEDLKIWNLRSNDFQRDGQKS